METEDLGTLTLRVARFGDGLREAHEFGAPPGPVARPWSCEFAECAVELCRPHLPDDYLEWLALVFARGAHELCSRHRGDGVEIVASFLRNVSLAVTEQMHRDTSPRRDDAVDAHTFALVARSPQVLPFDRLARVATAAGAVTLLNAGHAAHELVMSTSSSPLNAEELGWLGRLASGEEILAISVDAGYSERSMYRRLRQMWDRLGVTSREEGIALAVRRGWI